MLRLVLSVGILLRAHALELIFVRNFDRPSSIEKLGAGIWWDSCELCPNDSSTSWLSVSYTSWPLTMLQCSIREHFAIKEGQVALILISEALIDTVWLELSNNVLLSSWSCKESILRTLSLASVIWLRSSQVVYQLSSTSWTLMPFLELFLDDTNNILVETTSFLFWIASHTLWLWSSNYSTILLKL